MGYTHYWRHNVDIEPAAFTKICEDAEAIIATTEVPIGNSMGDAEPPTVSPVHGVITLNGIGEDSYESFIFEHQGNGFECCKTQHRPYDEVVTAILLSVVEHAGGVVRVSSDGNYDGAWSDGVALFEKATGRKAPAVPR